MLNSAGTKSADHCVEHCKPSVPEVQPEEAAWYQTIAGKQLFSTSMHMAGGNAGLIIIAAAWAQLCCC